MMVKDQGGDEITKEVKEVKQHGGRPPGGGGLRRSHEGKGDVKEGGRKRAVSQLLGRSGFKDSLAWFK